MQPQIHNQLKTNKGHSLSAVLARECFVSQGKSSNRNWPLLEMHIGVDGNKKKSEPKRIRK